MTDREAFESWYDAQPDGRIQPWDVWQAAAAAERERCAKKILELDKEKWFASQRDFAEACVDAIRKGE